MYRYTSSYGITSIIIHYQEQNPKSTRETTKYKFNFLRTSASDYSSISTEDTGFMPLGMVKIDDSIFHYIFSY